MRHTNRTKASEDYRLFCQKNSQLFVMYDVSEYIF